MITLREITQVNFEECIYLKLTEAQSEHIATNVYSLAEAYSLTNHDHYVPMAYAIYHNETMVGFIMAVYQPIDENDPDDEEDIYYLARLMIDKKYQGKGYGKEAVKKLLELMRTFPYGPATAVVLSLDPNNLVAKSLYMSLGFKETDEVDEDGDQIWKLKL